MVVIAQITTLLKQLIDSINIEFIASKKIKNIEDYEFLMNTHTSQHQAIEQITSRVKLELYQRENNLCLPHINSNKNTLFTGVYFLES
jgi:hypothetical protein